MPDFTATRTFLYVSGNVISPTQNTTNELGIYTPFNAAINATTGHTHSGSTGDGPKIPLVSPASRIVVGAAAALTATDVYIGMDHGAAKTVTFTSGGTVAFKRDVTVYDYTGNAGLYPITIVFAGGWTCQGQTSIVLAEDNGFYTFHYNDTDWRIVAS